jgi:hypothetical protein
MLDVRGKWMDGRGENEMKKVRRFFVKNIHRQIFFIVHVLCVWKDLLEWGLQLCKSNMQCHTYQQIETSSLFYIVQCTMLV